MINYNKIITIFCVFIILSMSLACAFEIEQSHHQYNVMGASIENYQGFFAKNDVNIEKKANNGSAEKVVKDDNEGKAKEFLKEDTHGMYPYTTQNYVVIYKFIYFFIMNRGDLMLVNVKSSLIK